MHIVLIEGDLEAEPLSRAMPSRLPCCAAIVSGVKFVELALCS